MSDDALSFFPDSLRERYEPLARVGSGGMGTVHRVRDRRTGAELALKLTQGGDDHRVDRRFQLEASTLAALEDPHIVRIFDYGTSELGPYLVMELIDGVPLDRLPEDADRVAVLRDAARGIAAVHRAGLVHRDVKPGNILHGTDGRTVLIDFGLVLNPDLTRLTRTEERLGSLAFMAPETLKGRTATTATDWYAFGITAFKVLEERLPYHHDSLYRIATGQEHPAPELERVKADSPEGRLILACCRPDPRDRPADLDAILAILDGAVPPGPRHAVAASVPGARSLALPSLEPTRRDPRVLMGLLFLAAIGLGIGTHVALAPPAPPGQRPAPAAPEEAGRGSALPERSTPFPAEFTRAAAAALEAAAASWVGPDGRVLAGDPPAGAAGYGQLLDTDPVAWSRIRGHLDALERFHRWRRAGGRPEDLPAETRARLEGLDLRFAAQDLPRPFFPFLYLQPSEDPGPIPAQILADPRLGDVLPASPVRGWTRVALDLGDRALAASASIQARLAAGEMFPVGYGPDRIMNLGSYLGVAFLEPAARRALAQELRAEHEVGRAFVYAASRALEGRGADAERLAVLLGSILSRTRDLLYQGAAFTDWHDLVGPDPVHPHQWAFVAHLCYALEEPRSKVGTEDREVLRAEMNRALRASFRTYDLADPAQVERAAWSLDTITRRQLKLRHLAEARGLLRNHRELVRSAGAVRQARLRHTAMGIAMVDEDLVAVPTPELEDWLTWWGHHPEQLRDPDHEDEVPGYLQAARAELARRR